MTQIELFPANQPRLDDIVMRRAWPQIARHTLWRDYALTELPYGDLESAAYGYDAWGKVRSWLDGKAAIDGYVLTNNDWVESFQLKVSPQVDNRLFTVRQSAKHDGHTEWMKIQRKTDRPTWFIKIYYDATYLPVAIGMISTEQLVALINAETARVERRADGTYWVVEWAASDAPVLLELRSQTVPLATGSLAG